MGYQYSKVVFREQNFIETAYNRAIHYTTGRFGKDSLQNLYGVPELSVLHYSTRLALLIIREKHQGAESKNHWKSTANIIGRVH